MANELWKVANHLLSENWNIELEPTCGKPCDEVIAEAILKKYPKFHKSDIEKWRSRHKKCDYCIYKREYPIDINYDDYVYCMAKRKNKRRNTVRPFCSLFQVKPEEKE